MKILVLGWKETRSLLPMKECINVIETAFSSLAKGDAMLPLRTVLRKPDNKGVLATMPGFLGQPRSLGVKAITVFLENTQFNSHQGAVILFDVDNGQPIALIDATTITAIRTAAASGVATKYLARKNATALAILGSGTQASEHLEAMLSVRPEIDRIRIWSRNQENGKNFVERQSSKWKSKSIELASSAENAARGSDIICTTTASKTPILEGDWARDGTHINAVGASTPGYRELDTNLVARSRLFVDRRESALNEADDVRIPIKEGTITESHILGEIGEVILGNTQGRISDSDVTLFKSLGLAVEDLASSAYVYEKAGEHKVGTFVEFAPAKGQDF
jgi:alanine dehydrogenase